MAGVAAATCVYGFVFRTILPVSERKTPIFQSLRLNSVSTMAAGIAVAAATCDYGFVAKTILTESAERNRTLIFQALRLKSATKSNGRIQAMTSTHVLAPRRETDPKNRVVITGMGLVSVFGNDLDIFYKKLLEGENGISMIDRFDTSDFPIKIAGQIRDFSSAGYIDKKIDQQLDDCWRYCLVAGKKALEDADLGQQVLENMDKTRIGVLIGSGIGAIKSFSSGLETLFLKGYEKITPFFIPSLINMGSSLLATETGVMGPNYVISTGCAAATTCIYAAACHIKNDDADVMVVGGTEACLTVTGIGGLHALGILSQRNNDPQKAYRPWDIDRDGTVCGEGSGILIMEKLEHALKRGAKIYAEYLGGASNCDAFDVTDASPDGLALCIRKSLEESGVSPEEVNYISPHGTSTRARDIVEVNAIKKVFKDISSKIKMNATKSLIGHTFGASGAIEAISTIQAINTGWLHPTANQYNIDPAVTMDTVPNVKIQHEVNVAVSFNCGFGGQNAAVVLAPFKP